MVVVVLDSVVKSMSTLRSINCADPRSKLVPSHPGVKLPATPTPPEPSVGPGSTLGPLRRKAVGGSTSRARARDTRHRHTSCEQAWPPHKPGSGVKVRGTVAFFESSEQTEKSSRSSFCKKRGFSFVKLRFWGLRVDRKERGGMARFRVFIS